MFRTIPAIPILVSYGSKASQFFRLDIHPQSSQQLNQAISEDDFSRIQFPSFQFFSPLYMRSFFQIYPDYPWWFYPSFLLGVKSREIHHGFHAKKAMMLMLNPPEKKHPVLGAFEACSLPLAPSGSVTCGDRSGHWSGWSWWNQGQIFVPKFDQKNSRNVDPTWRNDRKNDVKFWVSPGVSYVIYNMIENWKLSGSCLRDMAGCFFFFFGSGLK